MKSCVLSLLFACVYLTVTLFGGVLHAHEDHGAGSHQQCAACALHFQGTAEEPPATRVCFERAEFEVHFPFQITASISVEAALPPSRGPPVCA